jgi:YbgC/YbaW family acyl-CoA thioester hydrolase
MKFAEMKIISRFSDLDSQMHVNNSSYLNYIREAQYCILAENGFDFNYMVKGNVKNNLEKVIVRFYRQQLPQANLTVKSSYSRSLNNKIFFNQDIFNHEEQSCNFQTIVSIDDLEITSSFIKGEVFLENYILPEYNGKSKRSILNYKVKHVDLNGFNHCSDAVLWRLNEEARWNFFSEAGLSFDELYKKDMSLFWIEGAYEYFSDVNLNDDLEVYTWINRFDKARIYINQEIYSNSHRILLSEGQFLTVSLSKSKPLRIPSNIMKAFLPYTENSVDI